LYEFVLMLGANANMEIKTETVDLMTGIKRPIQATNNTNAKRKKISAGEKNPVQTLHELRKDTAYTFVSQEGAIHQPTFIWQVTVDGHTFEGKGSTKKVARNNAAQEALSQLGLVKNQDTEPIEEPVPKHNWYTQSMMETKPEIKIEKNGHIPTTQSDPIVKNAMQMLHEMRPGIKYECQTVIGADNKPIFVMSVVVDDITFQASATSKKAAQRQVAQDTITNHFKLETETKEDGVLYFIPPARNKAKKSKGANKVVPEGGETFELPKFDGEQFIGLNQLYGTQIQFETVQDEPNAVRLSVNVEGTIIEGNGINHQKAKRDAQLNAINFLKEMGLFEKRVEEMRERIAVNKVKSIANRGRRRFTRRPFEGDLKQENVSEAAVPNGVQAS